MRQSFSRELTLPGDPPATWALVEDVPEVLSWFSIVGNVASGREPGRYGAELRDRMGPFRLKADLEIAVERDPDERRIRASARGQDRQIGSRINVDVVLGVDAAPEGSTVHIEGTYEVTGRPATLGAGSIRKKADTILAEFFETASARLA